MTSKFTSNYLTKHKKYIDYRLSIIMSFLSDNENSSSLLDVIMSHLLYFPHNISLTIMPEECQNSIKELRMLIAKWDLYNDGDITGYIYQTLENRKNRKKKGQFFTPDDIVCHLTTRSIEHIRLNDFSILDPSCGSGQFLISAIKYIASHLLKSADSRQRLIQHLVKNNIYGIDIDPIAVKIARFNLMKISGCNWEDIRIFCANYLDKNKFHELNNSFDLIIGNPPWCSIFTINEKKYYRSNYSASRSGINTFTLFMERSFDLIKDNGFISFLIPDAFLNIKAHFSSRFFILNNASIKSIDLWGEKFKGVFAPSASIIMKRERDDKQRIKQIVNVFNRNKEVNNTSLLIPQASYYTTPENIFNIKHSRKAVEILSIIENQNCHYLKNKAKFFLGIVTGNNSRYISNARNDNNPDPIIIGKDIQQYRITYGNHYFHYKPDELQQVAPQNYYLTKNKILYRFIGRKLIFALDVLGYYSLNNVNGFIPLSCENSPEILLSVLNSKVMQYYYQNIFFTLKVLRGNLEKLPIKIISPDVQKRLKVLATNLMSNEDPIHSRERDNIEDIIFHEYNIRDKEAFLIEKHIQ